MRITLLGPLAAMIAGAVLCLAAPCFSRTSPHPKAFPASASSQMREAEAQLIDTSYVQSLQGAYWAVERGPSIVPTLKTMLTREKRYKKTRDDATAGFPFNAIWALAHIKSASARDALMQYYAESHNNEALLALKGWQTRARYGSSAGVLINSATLLAQPRGNGGVVARLRAGEQVQVIGVAQNSMEVNAHGGPAIYDRVRVLSTKQTGYIARASDGFTPLF